MSDKERSLRQQLADAEAKLRFIRKRQEEYLPAAGLPCQLADREEGLKQEIDRLRKRLRAVESGPPDELFYYSADRRRQKEELRRVFQGDGRSTQHLFAFVVHGGKGQCHEAFRDILKDVILPGPTYLRLGKGTTIKDYPMSWPAAQYSGLEALYKELRANLVEGINEQGVFPEDVYHFLATIPGPVLIYTKLRTKNFQEHGPEIVTDYLTFWEHFWKKWPDPVERQQLLVFLLIEYEQPQEWSHCLPRWLCRFLGLNRHNDRIRKSLGQVRLPECLRLRWQVISELSNIVPDEQEFDRWYDEAVDHCLSHPMPHVRGKYHLRQTFKEGVDAIFKKPAYRNGIPMIVLAKELEAMLEKINNGG